MTDFEKLRYVQNTLSVPAQYEGLAEECVELAHAALKMARIYRGEDPTPADIVEVGEKIYEEIADVLLCIKVLGLDDADLAHRQLQKLDRWYDRLYKVYGEVEEDEN